MRTGSNSHITRHIATIVALILFGVGHTSGVLAQARDGVRPVIESDAQIPGLHDAYEVPIYIAQGQAFPKPGGSSERVYIYFGPLVYLVVDPDESLMHNIMDDGTLVLYARWGDKDRAREVVKDWLRENGFEPDYTIVNPIHAKRARFESMSPNRQIHSQEVDRDFASNENIPIYFQFSDIVGAERFVEDLENRRELLRFRYSFTGISSTVCTATAELRILQGLESVAAVTGEGSSNFVSRNRVNKVFAELREVLRDRVSCSDPTEREMLYAMLTERLRGQQNQLERTWMAYEDAQNILQLNDNDFRADFTASLDETQKSVTEDIDKTAVQTASERVRNYAGGGGTAAWAAEASVGMSDSTAEAKQKFMRELEKRGYRTSWTGERFVPRTIEAIAGGQVRANFIQDFRIEFETPRADDKEQSVHLTPSARYMQRTESQIRDPIVEVNYLIDQIEDNLNATNAELQGIADDLRGSISEVSEQISASVALIHQQIAEVREEFSGLVGGGFHTCRLPVFGFERWGQVWEGGEDWSGWIRGGGWPVGCGHVADRRLRERGLHLGGTGALRDGQTIYQTPTWDGGSYRIEVLRTAERFNGNRWQPRYNYMCQLKIEWEPVFHERTDPRCGSRR